MISSAEKNKHLTEEQRVEIEECLGKGMTFKAIAKRIGKDPTTVSYKVKHHRIKYQNSFSTDSESCMNLLKAPYVCNGCPKKGRANYNSIRYVY